ncbi:MAG: hypothetical protein HQ547_06725, partial [Candidatus Omnitrophica bacterium]|nr:hypothetical protein [Candidatus Omnitrophota bacterium]
VKFFYGKDAFVNLKDIPGETFTVSSDLIRPVGDKEPTMRLKFLLMAEALLKTEGGDIRSVSQSALAGRFHVHRETINGAFRDLSDKKP